MAKMTMFRTEKSGDSDNNNPSSPPLLAQIPWTGLDGSPVPPGGYTPPPPHLLLQKEMLAYLIPEHRDIEQARLTHHQTLTQTAKTLRENIAKLFSQHGIPTLPLAESQGARGKAPDSALKKFRHKFDKPLGDIKPISDMIGLTFVFSDGTEMAKTVNLIRAAFPTDDIIPISSGQFWETVHDGRNKHSHPLYRCRKINIAFAPGQMAEVQLMTEKEYNLAQATDTAYHEQTNSARPLEDSLSLDALIELRAAVSPLQDVTTPEIPLLPGIKVKPPEQKR